MRRAFSTLSRRVASFRSAAARTFSTMPRTWGRPAEGPTFHPDFPTEFRPSPIAGVGWWARVDIPKGTLLRRLSVLDGSLVRFKSREDLEAAGSTTLSTTASATGETRRRYSSLTRARR